MAITTTYTLETVRAEFRANSVTDSDQSLSNVIGLSNGGYAVVYDSYALFDRVPRLEIYSAPTDTTPITVNVTNGGTTDMVGEPVITELTNGTIAVTWKEGPAGANKIVTTTVNATTGVVVAREIITGDHPDNADPEVVAVEGGRFAVVTDTGNGVNVFTFASDGSSPTAVFFAGTADPAVARLSDGRFVVTYTTGSGVSATLFNANGTAGTTTNVNDAGLSTPQVAALKNGGFALVLKDPDLGGQPGISLKLFNDAGTLLQTVRVDNDTSSLEDYDPEIAVLDNGFIVVTYTIQRSPTDTGVLTRIFDANGDEVPVAVFGNNVPLDDTGLNDEGQSSVAALRSGQFVATWTDSGAPTDTSGTGISATVRELVRTQIADNSNNFLQGDELRDRIFGGAELDFFFSSKGRDEQYGLGGDDIFRISAEDVEAGQVYDGGIGGFDEFVVLLYNASVADLTTSSVVNMEQLALIGQTGSGQAVVRITEAQMRQFGEIVFDLSSTGASSEGQVVEVRLGTATSLNLSGTIIKSAGPNALFRIFGDSSAETITGSSIRDLIDAGAGNDTLNGGAGADTLRGGLGNDTYVLGAEASGIDAVQDSGGVDTITSTITRSLAFFDFSEIEKLTLLGKANIAGTGNRLANTITGNAGRNTLDGGAGNDTIVGGAGNDTIIGNLGRDTLTGGTGNDIFKFTNKAHSRGSTMDIITDFDDRGRGNDRIDVSALFGPRMKYMHDDAFTGRGQVRVKDIAGPDVIVEVNTGGSLAADFSIRLKGTTLAEMSAGDFIL
ncbi:MAG: calcium-binding protein [Rhizobiaceae bacterium]|nr:calcium-binding protein [Rhizobiaceae bacterium]